MVDDWAVAYREALSNVGNIVAATFLYGGFAVAFVVLFVYLRRRELMSWARAEPLADDVLATTDDSYAARVPRTLPATVRASTSQRVVGLFFAACGLIFALAGAFGGSSDLGAAATMVPSGMLLFASGINSVTCRVRSESNVLVYRSWFRTKTFKRSDIKSIAVIPVPGNAYSPSSMIGVRVEFDTERPPIVPSCLRAFDTSKNRRALRAKASLLSGPN